MRTAKKAVETQRRRAVEARQTVQHRRSVRTVEVSEELAVWRHAHAVAVGRRARDIRLAKGLLPCQVACKLGMWSSNYCRMERGAHLPSADRIQRWAKVLGVPMKDLLTDPPSVFARQHQRFAVVQGGKSVNGNRR